MTQVRMLLRIRNLKRQAMKSDNYDTIDWSGDSESDANKPQPSTQWGETRINEAIHEANQQQLEPEQFIKDQKKGVVDSGPKPEFRTVYQKPKDSFLKRLRNWFRRSS